MGGWGLPAVPLPTAHSASLRPCIHAPMPSCHMLAAPGIGYRTRCLGSERAAGRLHERCVRFELSAAVTLTLFTRPIHKHRPTSGSAGVRWHGGATLGRSVGSLVSCLKGQGRLGRSPLLACRLQASGLRQPPACTFRHLEWPTPPPIHMQARMPTGEQGRAWSSEGCRAMVSCVAATPSA